jgi:hypothetical protein
MSQPSSTPTQRDIVNRDRLIAVDRRCATSQANFDRLDDFAASKSGRAAPPTSRILSTL